MDWHEGVHSVETFPLLAVPTAERPTADFLLAHHLNACTGRSRRRRQ